MDQIRGSFADDTIMPYEFDDQLNAIALAKTRTKSKFTKSPSRTCSMYPLPRDLLKQCSAKLDLILTSIVSVSLES